MTSRTRTVRHVDGDTSTIELATFLFAYGLGLVIAGLAWIDTLRPDPEPPADDVGAGRPEFAMSHRLVETADGRVFDRLPDVVDAAAAH